jgi:hypothetical protein
MAYEHSRATKLRDVFPGKELRHQIFIHSQAVAVAIPWFLTGIHVRRRGAAVVLELVELRVPTPDVLSHVGRRKFTVAAA